jgi:hypothetical protein
VDASVIAWVVESVTRTAAIEETADQEEAQRAWVYYRAYLSLYEEALVSPAEQRTQETWDKWTMGQIKELGRIAQNFLQEYVRITNRSLLGQDFIPVVPGHLRRRQARLIELPYPYPPL